MVIYSQKLTTKYVFVSLTEYNLYGAINEV